MDMLTQPLDDHMKAELETLRQSVRRISIDAQQPCLPRPMTLVAQADRILHRLAHWLMDDEQKQAVSDHPWQAFFLHAAACLCDIGLMDGSGVSADSKMALRSHDWIQRNWPMLGIKDAQRAGIMALVCLQMQDLSDLDSAPVASGSAHFAGTLINTSLLAACVHLARALELKSPATLMAILAHQPGDPDGLPATWMEAFDVDGVGPHPYLPATIRVKISCRDPELHRALKHHERVLHERLKDINQRIRPRFLFADLIYEIEPVGYQPVDLKYTVDTAAALQLFMGNRLFWTGERKKQIRQRIRLALVDIVNRLINTLDVQGAPMNTRNSLINHLAIFFDFSEVDDVVHGGLCQSLQQVVDKRFRDFVRVHFPHARSAGKIPEADGYNEKWQQRILAAFARPQ